MYTCPENDIHSVYLDGELPEEFVQEYEAHVASCAECSAKLEKLTQLKGFFHDDAESITFTQKQLDDSFSRLQAKMSYSSFKKSESKNTKQFPKFHGIRYFAAGIAAAAAVAFIIPGRSAVNEKNTSKFKPVARTSVLSAYNSMRVDGNLDTVKLSSLFGDDSMENTDGKSGRILNRPNSMEKPYAMKVSSDTVQVQKMILDDSYDSRTYSSVRPALADYDLFYPSFEEKVSNDHSGGFSFSLTSPILRVSFEVGK